MAEGLRRTLIIAEKPSAAKAIAEALGAFRAGRGCLKGPGAVITWASGHLVQLADPEHYDARFKRWRLEDLPIVPPAFELVPADAPQLRVIAQLATDADELVNACDAGREGELIFGYIYRYLGLNQPVRRLWAASLTRESIRDAYTAMRPGSDYARLYRSAECRSHGDWLTGINATRAFSRRFGDLLSVGRVQTPTLAMIVRRDREIAAFVVRPYWQVTADFRTTTGDNYRGLWESAEKDAGNRIWDEATARALAERVRQAGAGRITAVERRETEEKPPQLFDLTSLQREANRRFGLTAAATLTAAQSLYEAKLISYPRTDSRYLPTDQLGRLPGLLKRLAAQQPYATLADGGSSAQVRRWGRRVVNNAGVTDHHAIIPTGEAPTRLAGAAAKIYDLVVRRLLMQTYPSARYAEVDVLTLVAGEHFVTHGRTLLAAGWRVCERAESAERGASEEGQLSAVPAELAVGQAVTVAAVDAQRKETEPPRPFTDATLLGAMEGAGKELADDELRAAMKRHGLGTPATRASIIERLCEVGYVERTGRQLRATEKGSQLVDAVAAVGAAALLSPELTGEWEKRIADIQDGDADPDLFEREIADLVRTTVDQVKTAAAQPIEQAATGPAGVCPRCGAPVTRHGRNWTCDAECGFSLPGYLCRRAMRQEEIACLLSGGKTAQLKGFRSQAGKAFSAALSLSGERIEWHFRPRGRGGAAADGKPHRKSAGRSAPKSAAKAVPRTTAKASPKAASRAATKASPKAHTSRKPRER